MQREKRHFDPQPDQDKSDRRGCRDRSVQGRQDAGDIGHVQGAGENVDVADTEQVEAGTDGPHDDVIETRKGCTAAAHGNQAIGSDRSDFEQDVKIEGITGQDQAEQAGDQDQIESEEGGFPAGQFLFNIFQRRDGCEQGDDRNQDHHHRAQVVDHQFDAEWRSPVADRVADPAMAEDVAHDDD